MGKQGLKTLVLILSVFAGTYGSLVGIYRLENWVVFLFGLVLFFFALWLVLKSIGGLNERMSNYFGIFAGIFLWAFLGEVVEHMGVLEIARWHFFPLLITFTLFTILVAIKEYLPNGLLFSLATLNSIWFLHLIMVNQYELLGRCHFSTYLSCALFLLLSIFFGFRMIKARGISENMAYSLYLLLSAWTVLEYIWGWRLIPGPWML
jgi:hypothetical protein